MLNVGFIQAAICGYKEDCPGPKLFAGVMLI
jgi:hypothetical protein